ncbi:Ank2 [Symbiodinium natans]|uniref:Ank2 protein n=1 Tax=Symbiodinium natans TaxID=878477 RepID=A0A812JW63_9DINO|nr:Ank2 [Symbiodinium natans]
MLLRFRRAAKALVLLALLQQLSSYAFIPLRFRPTSSDAGREVTVQRPVVATQEPPVQETATAPAEEAEPEEPEQAQQAEEPPEPDDMPMLVEVEEGLEMAAKDYLIDLKKELIIASQRRNETSMVSMLNHFGPNSKDSWLASLLGQALRDILPELSGAELGFLVMSMAYSEIRAASVWHMLAEAAIEAALIETHPRALAELAFGFAWVQWQQPDLFTVLQVAMGFCKGKATEEQKRAFAWSCSRAQQPCTKLFGKPSPKVETSVASKFWGTITGMSGTKSNAKTLLEDPLPVLLLPEAVPAKHCDALLQLADSQKLWMNSSQLIANNDKATRQKILRSSRTSSTALLAWHEKHPSVRAVREWAARTLQVPEDFIEPLQLVRYTPGQKFGKHVDWIGEKDPGLWAFGQRMATMLVYLNTVPGGAGGETSFPELKLEVTPTKGSALVWPNVDAAGIPQTKVLHEALPVNGNQVKYAMNIWVRGRSLPDQKWIKWITPGAGHYTLPSVSFPEVVEHGGSQTGGWKYAEHKVPLDELASRVFTSHHTKPASEMPELARHKLSAATAAMITSVGLDIVDHVHWLANYHYHLAQKQWNIDKYEDEKQVEEDDLDEAFRPFGTIVSLHVPLNRMTGEAKGYCMLEYTAYEEASAALVAMNGRDMRHGIQLLTMEHLRIALLARLRAIEESGRDAALKWHGFARRTAGARYAQIAAHCIRCMAQGHCTNRFSHICTIPPQLAVAAVQKTRKFPSIQEQEQKEMMHRQEVIAERRKRDELHAWADREERRLGLKRMEVKDEFQPHQRFEGEVVEANLRGPHPGLKRAPGYTWCNSKDRRDVQSRKMTDLSHVRSSSHFDGPGPGEYLGHEEQSRLLKKSPSYVFGLKKPAAKIVGPSLNGPGYTGPDHAWDRVSKVEIRQGECKEVTPQISASSGHGSIQMAESGDSAWLRKLQELAVELESGLRTSANRESRDENSSKAKADDETSASHEITKAVRQSVHMLEFVPGKEPDSERTSLDILQGIGDAPGMTFQEAPRSIGSHDIVTEGASFPVDAVLTEQAVHVGPAARPAEISEQAAQRRNPSVESFSAKPQPSTGREIAAAGLPDVPASSFSRDEAAQRGSATLLEMPEESGRAPDVQTSSSRDGAQLDSSSDASQMMAVVSSEKSEVPNTEPFALPQAQEAPHKTSPSRSRATDNDSQDDDDGFGASSAMLQHRFASRVSRRLTLCDPTTILVALAWFQLSREKVHCPRPGFARAFKLRLGSLGNETWRTAAWAARWFELHRRLSHARSLALAAARKHHAVDNASSAVSHLLEAAFWVVRWFEVYRKVHIARQAALYVARTPAAQIILGLGFAGRKACDDLTGVLKRHTIVAHLASEKAEVSNYLVCATWVLPLHLAISALIAEWPDGADGLQSRGRELGTTMVPVAESARPAETPSGLTPTKSDQVAQKYAAALGNVSRAVAASWFRWWRDWLEKGKTAHAMAKKYAWILNNSAQAVAMTWFDHFRAVATERRSAAGADAAAKQRRQLAESLGRRSGEDASWVVARSWYQSWNHARWVQRFQQRLAAMPSAAGSWSTSGVVVQQWRLRCAASGIAATRGSRRARWRRLFVAAHSECSTSLHGCLLSWHKTAVDLARARRTFDRMISRLRHDAAATEQVLRVWQAWSYETAKTRAFKVMEEAIGLRDDGLALCARVARQREMMGPAWSLLAVWWFWVATCRTSLGTVLSMKDAALEAGDQAWQRLARCTELQSAAAERALTPICCCMAWFAWASTTSAAWLMKERRAVEEAKKRPEMMAARCASYLEDFDVSLYLSTTMSAWTRYVAVTRMDKYQQELDLTRSNYKLALEEHNAALDTAGVKYEESLAKKKAELKEVEQRYLTATASRNEAGEALESQLSLAEAQSVMATEEKYQREAMKYEASLETLALRQRLTEDKLSTEAQAAQDNEALVMQRHAAALKSMEQKHHLSLKAAEQKIARALEKHRLDLEMKYKNEAEKRHQAALDEMLMVLERQRAELASMERSEELLVQKTELSEARWSAEMEDVRLASRQQWELLSQQHGGHLEEARRAAHLEAQQQFQTALIQQEVMQGASELECRLALQTAAQQEELSTQSREAALRAAENKHQLAIHLSEQKIRKALEKHRADLESRYHDALMRKEQENATLVNRCATLETELTASDKKAKSTLATSLEVAQQQHEAASQIAAERHALALVERQLRAEERHEACKAVEEKQEALLSDAEEKLLEERQASAQKLQEEIAKCEKELQESHESNCAKMAEDHQNEVVRLEAALEAGQIKYHLSVEKYTNVLEATRQKHDKAMDLLKKELEEKHITSIADMDHQYSHAMLQCEAIAESAETRLELVEQKYSNEVESLERLQELQMTSMKTDLEERHAAAVASAQKQESLMEAEQTWLREKQELSEEAFERREQNAVQRLTKELEAAKLKYQLALERHEGELGDLKFQHETVLRSRDSALEALAAKLKQTELRHGKAMEAAEAKFQKAFDRVKRCAIEEARQQILDHRRRCKACQQEPLPLEVRTAPPPPKAKPAAKPRDPEPQLTQRIHEVMPVDPTLVEVTLESLVVQRSRSWIWAQDMQRAVDQGIQGILELHEAMLLLVEQAARHSLLQGQEDPRAESRIASVKQLVTRVGEVNEELGKLRRDRAEFWFALHETSEEAVRCMRQANSLPAPVPAVVKRLDFEIQELCDDQKKMAEAFNELALRLKAAGGSLQSLQEARNSLPKGAHASQEAQALDEAGVDAQKLLQASREVVSALVADVRDLFYLVDGSNLRPRLRPHPALSAPPGPPGPPETETERPNRNETSHFSSIESIKHGPMQPRPRVRLWPMSVCATMADSWHRQIMHPMLEPPDILLDEADGQTQCRCLGQEANDSQVSRLLTRGESPPEQALKIFEAGPNATLHDAAWEGNVDLVRKLLRRESPDLPDEEGSTPLHLAADEGYLEVVRCLVEEGKASCVDAVDGEGNTALLLAAKEGRTKVVDYLLTSAKLQAPQQANSNGETPLLCAVQKGRADIVKLLLGHSATVDISNNDGETPLNLAAGKGDAETVQLLLVEGKSQSVDTPDRLGWTPLLMASHGGHVGVLRLLLKSRAATANSHSGTGETPLLRAAKRGQVEVAKLLLNIDEAAMIDTPDRDGHTPLMMAAQFGFAETLRLLLGYKASIDLRNKAGFAAGNPQHHTSL